MWLNDILHRLQATVPIVSIPECQQDYRGVSRVNINEDMVCAGQGRRDSCAGDSGGPMLSNFANGRWSVIGIVSFGVDCASERHPGYVLYLLTPINAHFSIQTT